LSGCADLFADANKSAKSVNNQGLTQLPALAEKHEFKMENIKNYVF